MTAASAAPISTKPSAFRPARVLDAQTLVGHMLEDVDTSGGSAPRNVPSAEKPVSGKDSKNITDEKISAVGNRLALQIQSVPSLQSFLADYAVVPTGKPDGSVKIQFDFLKLPREIIPDLERLLSVDQFHSHRLVKYIKNGQARTGLEIEVIPSELPGDPYQYAF